MTLFLHFIAFLLILSAFLGFAVAWNTWKRRSIPAMTIFSLLNLAACIWSLGNAFETLTLDVETATVFAWIEYIGIAAAPPLFLMFSLSYTSKPKWLRPGWLALIWLFPVLTLAAVFTNSWHHQYWTRIVLVQTTLYNNLVFEHGILFYAWIVVSYFYLLLGSIILIGESLRVHRTFRRQLILLVIGILIPWLSNFAYVMGVGRMTGLDITAISFTVSFALIYLAIFRSQLFDLAPFAREQLMDVLNDGVVITDLQQRVVDINAAACRLLHTDPNQAVGKAIGALFENAGGSLNLAEKAQQVCLSFHNHVPRYVSIFQSPLFEEKQRLTGSLLVIQDVTERYMTEQMLYNRTEQLSLVMDGTPALVAYIDADLSYRYVNRAYADFYGRQPQDFIGACVQDMLPEHIFAFVQPYYEKVLQGERVSFENVIEDAQGCKRLVYTTLSPHVAESGEVKSFFVLHEDITEIKKVESAERDQRNLAEALRRVVTALNTTMDFELILEVILATVGEVVPHDAANIALIDEQKRVRIVRARGYRERNCEEYLLSLSIPLDEIPNWRNVYETRSSLIVDDTAQNPLWVTQEPTNWIRSYACAPIIIQGCVIGFLNLDSETPYFFTPEHGARLQTFADEAAVAIGRANLFEETNHRAELLATVNSIGLAITTDLDQDTILRTLLEKIKQAAPVDLFYIALYNAKSNQLEIPIFYENGLFKNSPPVLKKSVGLTGFVIESNTTLHIPDLLNPTFQLPAESVTVSPRQVRSYVGVPMVFRERVIGAITMQSYMPNAYTPDQVHLLETVATQVTIALENARLFSQMELLAMTDTLTGIYNRRQFMAMGLLELQRSIRYHRDFSMIMMDIDHFKKVNDSYGHLAGDSVLQQIAALISHSLRSVDILGRYGGEEFCILLPETGLNDAQNVAERLRTQLEKKVLLVDGMQIKVTASFGVTTYTPKTHNMETLLDQADHALYAAKQGGRNRVEIYSPEMEERSSSSIPELS